MSRIEALDPHYSQSVSTLSKILGRLGISDDSVSHSQNLVEKLYVFGTLFVCREYESERFLDEVSGVFQTGVGYDIKDGTTIWQSSECLLIQSPYHWYYLEY